MTAMDELGLMRIQIEDGSVHSVEEAFEMISDFLDDLGRYGDHRADRYGTLLVGIEISFGEFATSYARAGSASVELSRLLRPKTFNGILKFSDLHRETLEAPGAEE